LVPNLLLIILIQSTYLWVCWLLLLPLKYAGYFPFTCPNSCNCYTDWEYKWNGQVISSSGKVVTSSCGDLQGCVTGAVHSPCFHLKRTRRISSQLSTWIIEVSCYTLVMGYNTLMNAFVSGQRNTLHHNDTPAYQIFSLLFRPAWSNFTDCSRHGIPWFPYTFGF